MSPGTRRPRAWLGATALLLALGRPTGAATPKPKAVEASCAEGDTTSGPGSLDPFRPPAPKAVELNAAGKVPYREGKWEEARAQYRAAQAADPEFLAPRLNVACSFVRQDRYAEATAEVVALLDQGYVPWAREILEAADLGALKARPEMKEIQRAMAASAARWGDGLGASLLFVARQRPPLRVPDGAGVFILNPHQEIWAYTPRTKRYRQLTAEDGHVVAMAQSADGRRVLYVTAQKLVRGAKPGDVALRGVAVRELTLATMSVGPAAAIAEDVRRLEIFASLRVAVGEHPDELLELTPAGALAPITFEGRWGQPIVTLTGRGVAPKGEERFGGQSRLVARPAIRPGTDPTIEISAAGGKPSPLKTGAGGGLGGLPIP